MKVLITQKYNSYLDAVILVVNKYLLGKGYNGITLWPFVIIRNASLAKDPIFLNHERIHLKQQMELLVLPFYIWYITEFFIKWIKYGHSFRAYRNISFEREAYANENNLTYCKHRKFWNFLKYFPSKDFRP